MNNSQMNIVKEENIKMNNDKKMKAISKPIAEWIAFSAFILLTIIMYVFHEPWYDEIQAWMVASDASFKEMIFELPHYEGHPPFWTLLLSVFAKTGVPMEIGLRIPTLLFSTIAAYVVIFKAPFKRWIRCLLPFGYYFFYQYTVICRPYSLMFLGFVLAAYFYKERNQKPVRYLIALYMLCMSSAYGILFAGVFCVIWTVEIIKELKGKAFIKRALKDKRSWSLLVMLILSVGLLMIIWPGETAFAQVRVVEFSKIRCLIYTFLVLPADALVSDIALMGRLQQFDSIIAMDYATILCVVISVILYIVMLTTAHIYRKKALLIWPYVAFAGYAALGYFYNHHIGIAPMFILFVFWCAFADKPETIKLPGFLLKLEKSMEGFSQKAGYFFVILAVGMALFWSFSAIKNDIMLPAWYAKGLAAMMEEYELTEYKVLNQWTYQEIDANNVAEDDISAEQEDGYTFSTELEQLDANDYYQYVKMCNFVDILAYSDERENYIYNFNEGNENLRYVDHNMMTQEESITYLHELGAEHGYPDVIIGNPEVLGMMGLDVKEHNYIPVYGFVCYRINKYNTVYAREFVYVKEEIYFTRDDWPIFDQIANGFAEY